MDYRNNDDYFKAQLNYKVFGVGEIYAEYRYEEIRDNIRDKFLQHETSMQAFSGGYDTSTRYKSQLFYDELEYRNSKVNRIWVDSNVRALPSITIENRVKFESNRQIEGTMYDKVFQPKDEIRNLAMVNKIVYTKQWGNFIFSPGINLRFYKKVRSESIQPLDHYLMRIPLIMFKYIISTDTNVALGLQGIPGLEFQYKDYVQTVNDLKRKTYTLQLENKSTYFGYNIWAAVGILYDQLDYDEEYRAFEEYKSTSTFIRIFLGW